MARLVLSPAAGGDGLGGRRRGQLRAPRPLRQIDQLRPRNRCRPIASAPAGPTAGTRCPVSDCHVVLGYLSANFLGGAIKLIAARPRPHRGADPTRSTLSVGCSGRRDRAARASPRYLRANASAPGLQPAEFPASPTVVPGEFTPMATPRRRLQGTWWCRPGRRVSRLSAVCLCWFQYRYDQSVDLGVAVRQRNGQKAAACGRKPGASWR